MMRISGSHAKWIVAIAALTCMIGCGKKEEETADAPKGEAKRSDVQSASMGSGSGQSLGSTQKPNFDNTK